MSADPICLFPNVCRGPGGVGGACSGHIYIYIYMYILGYILGVCIYIYIYIYMDACERQESLLIYCGCMLRVVIRRLNSVELEIPNRESDPRAC